MYHKLIKDEYLSYPNIFTDEENLFQNNDFDYNSIACTNNDYNKERDNSNINNNKKQCFGLNTNDPDNTHFHDIYFRTYLKYKDKFLIPKYQCDAVTGTQ